jgi:hypothetical protein
VNKEGFFQPGQYASIPKALLADTDVGLAAKIVYLGLQSYLDADKTQAWPGAADLQRRTGLSRRAIQQGIDQLIAAGWIRKDSRSSPYGTNLYTLYTQPRLPENDNAQNALPAHQMPQDTPAEPPESSAQDAPEVAHEMMPKGSAQNTPPGRRTECASAQNALPLAHQMRKGGAPNAHKEHHEEPHLRTSPCERRRAPPHDARVREFIDWFSQEYRTALGRPYVVIGPKDGAAVKRLLQSLTVDELRKAARVMLADSWAKGRADIGLLASKINSWLAGHAHPPGKSGAFVQAKAATNYDSLVQKF